VYEHEGTTPGESPGTEPPKVPRRFVGAPAAPAPKRGYKPDPAWDKLLLIIGAVAVVVAVLVAPGILNRGGQNPVAEAAQATSEASGVRITFTGSAQGSVPMSLSGKGVMNGETNRASLTMSATGSSAAGTQSFTLEEIVDGGDLYMRSPELGSAFGDSAQWLLMRSEVFGDLFQADATGMGAGMASPTQQLDALEDASYEVAEVGRERVNGVVTTRYRALLDIDELTEQLKSEVSGEFGELIEQSMEEISGATVDVWIDADGLLRRETSTAAMESLGTFTMTMDFSDYGIHPNIQIPPSSQVYDVTSLVEDALDEFGG
jgi:hypothetical protein